jgi:sarcosine oxidase subunit gamma
VPELPRRSPLDGILVPGVHGTAPNDPGVVIAERRHLSLVQVIARRGREQAATDRLGLDPAPGRAGEIDAGTVLWIAPGAWMIVAADESDALRRLGERLHDLAAVVDQSHSRTALRLAGSRARDVLAKGCRLDLHPRTFHPGMCAQTVIAQIGVLLHQTDDRPTYDLYVPAGYAVAFLDWLAASAAEFGYRTVEDGAP